MALLSYQKQQIMKRKQFYQLLLVIILFCVTHAQGGVVPAFKVTVTGKGQPMLFIPGHTCSGEVWKETVARFAKKYECHVFTLAGYAGTAPLTEPPFLNTFKKQIINYIVNKKLNNVILVGHSIGGFLSLGIAAEIKGHLQKVIVVDGMPFYAGVMDPGAKSGFNEEQAKAMLAGFEKMDKAQLKINQLVVARSMCSDSTKWDAIAEWGATSDRKTMAYAVMEMMGDDIRQQIAAIKVPVLVIDAYAPSPLYPTYTQEYSLNMYKQQYEQCKTCEIKVTPPSKHFVMYDVPEWFYQEIEHFIAAV